MGRRALGVAPSVGSWRSATSTRDTCAGECVLHTICATALRSHYVSTMSLHSFPFRSSCFAAKRLSLRSRERFAFPISASRRGTGEPRVAAPGHLPPCPTLRRPPRYHNKVQWAARASVGVELHGQVGGARAGGAWAGGARAGGAQEGGAWAGGALVCVPVSMGSSFVCVPLVSIVPSISSHAMLPSCTLFTHPFCPCLQVYLAALAAAGPLPPPRPPPLRTSTEPAALATSTKPAAASPPLPSPLP